MLLSPVLLIGSVHRGQAHRPVRVQGGARRAPATVVAEQVAAPRGRARRGGPQPVPRAARRRRARRHRAQPVRPAVGAGARRRRLPAAAGRHGRAAVAHDGQGGRRRRPRPAQGARRRSPAASASSTTCRCPSTCSQQRRRRPRRPAAVDPGAGPLAGHAGGDDAQPDRPRRRGARRRGRPRTTGRSSSGCPTPARSAARSWRRRRTTRSASSTTCCRPARRGGGDGVDAAGRARRDRRDVPGRAAPPDAAARGRAATPGIFFLWVTSARHRLPKACGAVVEIDPDHVTARTGFTGSGPDDRADPLGGHVARRRRRRRPRPHADHRRHRAHQRRQRDPQRRRLRRPLRRRATSSTTRRRSSSCGSSTRAADAEHGLRVVVGMQAGAPFVLDLRQDGPHALVAGTTGAGKCEFLQSFDRRAGHDAQPGAGHVPARRLQGRRGVQGVRRPAAHRRAWSPTSTATRCAGR